MPRVLNSGVGLCPEGEALALGAQTVTGRQVGERLLPSSWGWGRLNRQASGLEKRRSSADGGPVQQFGKSARRSLRRAFGCKVGTQVKSAWPVGGSAGEGASRGIRVGGLQGTRGLLPRVLGPVQKLVLEGPFVRCWSEGEAFRQITAFLS